jgi:hypothetical protein
MANRELIKNTKNMYNTQIKNFIASFNEKVGTGLLQDLGSYCNELFNGIKDILSSIGQPSMKIRKIPPKSPPKSSDINDTFTEVYNDTRTLFDEQGLLGEGVRNNFNFSVTEHLRLRNKIKRIGEKVNTYIVTAKNTIQKLIIIRDSFITEDKIDITNISNPVHVDTSQGIVTLQPGKQIQRTGEAEVIYEKLTPDTAMYGTFFLPYKKGSNSDELGAKIETGSTPTGGRDWEVLPLTSDIDNYGKAHALFDTLFDEKKNTWIEAQLINFDKEATKDIHKGWGLYRDKEETIPIYDGVREKDKLSLTLILKLKEPCTVNWINLVPYFPPDSNIKYKVDSIETSLNNAGDYYSAITDKGNENQSIGGDSATADLDVKDREKYTGQGMWLFPSRYIQYIRISLSCETPYDCYIGHPYVELEYDEVTTKSSWGGMKKTTTSVKKVERVKTEYDFKQDVLSFHSYAAIGAGLGAVIGTAVPGVGTLLGAGIGFLLGLFSNAKIEKTNQQMVLGVDAFPGWRWCIGISELNAYAYSYDQKSVFISKEFVLPKPAAEISIDVSEYIPEEFYKKDIKTRNQWIKYYLSIDGGTTWTAISPLNHRPVGYADETFPNKSIAITTGISEEAKIPGKTYITSDKPAKGVKFLAELSRPDDMPDMTPAIYDYEIRILPQESE